jgi:hypothetical protein
MNKIIIMLKFIRWFLYVALVWPIIYSFLDVIYKTNLSMEEVYYIGKTTRNVFSFFLIAPILLSIYMFRKERKLIYIFFILYHLLFLIVMNYYWTSI